MSSQASYRLYQLQFHCLPKRHLQLMSSYQLYVQYIHSLVINAIICVVKLKQMDNRKVMQMILIHSMHYIAIIGGRKLAALAPTKLYMSKINEFGFSQQKRVLLCSLLYPYNCEQLIQIPGASTQLQLNNHAQRMTILCHLIYDNPYPVLVQL